MLCLAAAIALYPKEATASEPDEPKAAKYTTENPLVYEDIYDLPPYTFLNRDGEPAGFNIDLIKTILKRLDIPYVIRLKNTANAYNDLKEGKSDLMLGMRTEYHSQFGKYGRNVVALFTHGVAPPKDFDPGIRELKDIKKTKVAVQNNSVSHRTAVSVGLAGNVIPHDDIYDIIQQTAAKDSGLVLWNTLSLNYIIKLHGLSNLTVTPISMPNGDYRFMSHDEDLLRRVDSVFETLIINEELQPIRNKWFYPDVKQSGIPPVVWYIVWSLTGIILLLIIYNRISHIQINRINKANEDQSRRLELYLKTGKIKIWTYDIEQKMFKTFMTSGENQEEYTRLGFSVFFNDDDYKQLCAAIDDVATRRKKTANTLTRCHKPTTPDIDHYFEIKISVLHSKGGIPVTLLGIQQNVTDEKRRHIEMRNLLLRHDTVFNTVTEDMAYFDSSGILTDINDKACKTFGITDKKSLIAGKISINDMPPYSDFDISKPEKCHSSIIIDEHDRKRTGGNTPALKIPEEIKYYEYMVLPIFKDDGTLRGILTIGRDVTWVARNIQIEHKKEQRIIADTARQHEYISNINYALEISQIWLVNYYPKTRIFEMTHNIEKPALKFSQLRCVMTVDMEDRNRAANLINRLDRGVAERLYIKLKTRLKDKKGKNVYIQINLIPICDSDGKTDHYFGLCRDVSMLEETETRLTQEMEKARDAENVKTAFMKNVSYEIRTPLYSVMGFAEMFNIEHSKEDETVFMEEIRKNSTLLLNLINDILFLSRLDANMVEFNSVPTDFAGMFTAFCMNGWSRGLKEGVKPVTKEAYEQLVIDIDQQRIEYVVETLAQNSAVFTENGFVSGRYEYHHDCLEISMEDSGAGIPAETLKTIFTNMNANESTEECGLRIKLQICRKIVEKMGGTMDIESELGKGTTVWIRIPCKATTIKKKNILI